MLPLAVMAVLPIWSSSSQASRAGAVALALGHAHPAGGVVLAHGAVVDAPLEIIIQDQQGRRCITAFCSLFSSCRWSEKAINSSFDMIPIPIYWNTSPFKVKQACCGSPSINWVNWSIVSEVACCSGIPARGGSGGSGPSQSRT